MTKNEILLICLMEECGEVVQAASKCLRFTEEHKHINYNKHNKERLIDELHQLIALIDIYDCEIDPNIVIEKQKQFYDYLKVSECLRS
jgi:NTP pyrophosphatase (non-canonical NTP hydrolase)